MQSNFYRVIFPYESISISLKWHPDYFTTLASSTLSCIPSYEQICKFFRKYYKISHHIYNHTEKEKNTLFLDLFRYTYCCDPSSHKDGICVIVAEKD